MRVIFALALLASASGPAFDVASVKPSLQAGDRININLGTVSHGEVTLGNATLSECIQFAYGLMSEDQVAGPDWIRDRALRVDVIGKSKPEKPRDELLAMLRGLLTERFELRMHREQRPLAHYELLPGKGAVKFSESRDQSQGGTVLKGYGRGKLQYAHLSMDRLALLLSRQMKAIVIDRTGLRGYYDVDLQWSPDDAPPAGVPLPDVFAAVRDQAGLKLAAAKTPVEVIVVDSALKVPLAN
ncbi:MAG TPA: TIGR03435 family protein [Candidatus Limnocylindrales bacterium]|nr:TIGR03435 family protein [Candidatus Limnocylindrales bacterium]